MTPAQKSKPPEPPFGKSKPPKSVFSEAPQKPAPPQAPGSQTMAGPDPSVAPLWSAAEGGNDRQQAFRGAEGIGNEGTFSGALDQPVFWAQEPKPVWHLGPDTTKQTKG